jgi:hypothetical protein
VPPRKIELTQPGELRITASGETFDLANGSEAAFNYAADKTEVNSGVLTYASVQEPGFENGVKGWQSCRER